MQRVFTRVTNISVGDTLTLRRMRLACNMVKTGKPGTIKVFMRLVISYLPPTTMRERSVRSRVFRKHETETIYLECDTHRLLWSFGVRLTIVFSIVSRMTVAQDWLAASLITHQ